MYSVNEIFETWARIFKENVENLTKLDSIAGDADLGIVMNDGFSKTSEFLNNTEQKDIGMMFYQAGKYFNSVAPSSMGTLLSAGMINVGKKLRGKETLEDQDIYTIVYGIGEGVANVGKAKEGEKTFLDGIMPAARALEKITDIKFDIKNAVRAAQKGVEAATKMVGKHGRIAFRGDASVGIIDPGTVVARLLVEGLEEVIIRH